MREELRQNNKEDVSSSNTVKVVMLEKIEEKVKKERIREGHGMKPREKGVERDGEVEVVELGQKNKEDVAA